MYFDVFNYGENIKSKYVDFSININIELSKQLYLLKEDLIHIKYTNGYILDIGYYPQFDLKRGLFQIVVSKNEYDNKVISYSAKDINTLIEKINLAVDVIKDTFQDIYTFRYSHQSCARNQWGLVKIKCEKSENGFQLFDKSNLGIETLEYVYNQMLNTKEIDVSKTKATILYAEYYTIEGRWLELPLLVAIHKALKQYLDK